MPTVEGKLLDKQEIRLVRKKNLFTSGCISQSSVGMHLGVYGEPSWGLASTGHTGPVGALDELPLSSFRTRMEHTYPTSSCYCTHRALRVGRSATRILSCALPRVFFGPWDKYDFIWLECMKYSCQGAQMHLKQKAIQWSGQSYHRVSAAGTAALVS